jgi:hypothetical protein
MLTARAELAKQLRARERAPGSARHYRARGPWKGQHLSHGWRHLPHSASLMPAPPPAAAVPLARILSPCARARPTSLKPMEKPVEKPEDDVPPPVAAPFEKWTPRGQKIWWELPAAKPLALEMLQRRKGLDAPRSYFDEDGHEHELAPEATLTSSSFKSASATTEEPHVSLTTAKQYAGQIRHHYFEQLYAASSLAPLPRRNHAVDAIFGCPPPSPPPPRTPDLICPGAFPEHAPAVSARSMTQHQRRNTHLHRASHSARARSRSPSPDDWAPMLTDEECINAFHATEALPPFKRVQERLRLLREQPSLREWISARAQQHRADKLAELGTDFVARNKDPKGLEETKQRALSEQRVVREKRTVRAQVIVANANRGALSSEQMTQVRQVSRLNNLRRGFSTWIHSLEAHRAKRWALLMRLATATTTMRSIAKLARIVKRMRTTSRTISAVRTVQRRFRERRARRAMSERVHQVMVVQRLARRYIFYMRRRKLDRAAGTIVNFLEGCDRLSPMEMAIKRYLFHVRLMQRFVRGYQVVTEGRLISLRLQWMQIENVRLVELYGDTGVANLPTLPRSSKAPAPAPAPAPATSDVVSKKRGGTLARDRGGVASATFTVLPNGRTGTRKKGLYAGVPENIMHLPLPHIPAERRQRALKRILREMRRTYLEDVEMWNQKVQLKAEQHPAFIAGQRGVQRLAVIQHELTKDVAAGKSTTMKYASVLAIMDNMAVAQPDTAQRAGWSSRRRESRSRGNLNVSTSTSLTRKLQRLNVSVSAQRAALEEIKRSLPCPYPTAFAPKEMLQRAFDELHMLCTKEKSFEERPINLERIVW